MAQQLPNPLQFQGSAESKSFNPITPASSTKAAIEDANRLSNSWDAAAQHNLQQEKRAIAYKDAQNQYNFQALAGFSQTLTKKLTEIQEQTEQDIKDGEAYDYFMSGFDDSVPANQQHEQIIKDEDALVNEANRTGDAAARLAFDMESSTGNPVMGNMAWQRFGGLARGVRAEEAIILQARSNFNGWLQTFLASDAVVKINGQAIPIQQAINSGDQALTTAALTAARFEFIRQNGLQNVTKRNFVKHLMPTMMATEGAISSQLVLGAIKGQREERQQEIEGIGYNMTQDATPGTVGTTFETLSQQFFQGGLGLSRGQANALAVKTMIASLEDQGNVDALEAMLDVRQKPDQAGSELRRLYGNDINDAIRRAQGIAEQRDAQVVKDIESDMYAQLAGATDQQQRDQIIEQTAQALERAGQYRQARQLRQERDELAVSGSNEVNAARLDEAVRTGAATAEQVEQAVLRGDITREQGNQILRNNSVTPGSESAEKDLKNPLFKGIADSYGDGFEDFILNQSGLKKDVYGRILPGADTLLSVAPAEILRQQGRNDIQRIASDVLAINSGKSESEKQALLHAALKEWYKDQVKTDGGKYFIPDRDKGARVRNANGTDVWNPQVRGRLENLLNSPLTLARPPIVSGTASRDFSRTTLVNGTTLTREAVNQFRRIRGDRLFSKETLEILTNHYNETGVFQQGLQKAAQQLGMSPLALLNQQLTARQLPPIIPQFNVQSNSPGVAPTTGVAGAQRLMSMGFPARGAAWLAGNIQQESGWNGQRNPWNDNGALSGGLASWRADRLTAVQNRLGSVTRASNEAQLKYMVQELQRRNPEAYRIFMNANATEKQLIRASKDFWGYGDEGSRYDYARQIEAQLNNRGSRATGSGSQRAIQVGRQLLSQGVRPWQHSAFDIDKGHVGSGGRVGSHSPNSYHYSNQALDIPENPNGEAALRRTFNYLRQNMQRLGIAELYWDKGGYYKNGRSIGGAGSNAIPGHGGHIHVSFS